MFDVSVVLRVVCDWCEWLAFGVGLVFAFFDCCLRLSVFAVGYVGFACGVCRFLLRVVWRDGLLLLRFVWWLVDCLFAGWCC